MESLKRHKVFRSDRVKVTEDLIKIIDAKIILELGAGDYSFDYLKKDDTISWTKADFAEPCNIACNFNDISFELPFDNNSIELIICTQLLEHLLWPQIVLKESHRVLGKNGYIIVSVPNITSLSYRLSWLLGHLPSCAASGNLPIELGSTAYIKENGELVGGHVIDFNLKRTLSLLEYAGFRISKIKGSGIIWHRQIFPHWLVPVSLSSNIICLAKK